MISATLIGGGSPQNVQIVVDVTPAGVAWTLVGSTADGKTWPVPGGAGVGDGQQLVLIDNRAPGNRSVTYVFSSGGSIQTSNAVLVAFAEDFVLQTLSGSRALSLGLHLGSLDTSMGSRQQRFRVSGRRRPVVRYDVSDDIEGQFVLLVEQEQSADFKDMIGSGEPLLYRLGTQLADLDPVAVISYGALSSMIYPVKGLRAWSMPYAVIDDPYLDVRLGAFSWDNFEAAWAGKTWTDLDVRMAGLTWDQFDTFDWSTI